MKQTLISSVAAVLIAILVVVFSGQGKTVIQKSPDFAGVTNLSGLEVGEDGFSVANAGAVSLGSGTTTATGKTVVRGGFTEGGQLTISTSSPTYTLTQDQMKNVKVIAFASVANASATVLTLPATSTMTVLIPNAGDTQEWIIDNLHTSAATTTTVTAGTGIDLDGITTNDDILNGGVSGRLECWRLVNTDVRCIIEEMVDAG